MKKNYVLMAFIVMFGFSMTAQTIDQTGNFTPVIGDSEIAYVEFSFVDGDADRIYDCAVAFLDGPMAAYGDYSAVIVMYDASKFGFKFRNAAGKFVSDVDVIPVPGQVYKMWVTFNIKNQTYSVDYLTTGMSTHARIATDLGFRKNPITEINTWATYHNPSAEEKDIATVLEAGKVAKVGDVIAGISNTFIDNNLEILVNNQSISVLGVESYEVFNLQGIKVAEVLNNAEGVSTALNKGVYVVKAGNSTQKVVVR